ncbi:RiPP maturation radical SAM C-methyltransferase [Streptomyces griseorubiginosus]|uniref:RiPP maturation radical SAM C-methyltransferase n=1 Tax=Streptomyces griseorubiginosus TaxID=67304 RepID=UPI0033A69C2C
MNHDTTENPLVCLVSMPYASVQRPSMALGLLQGILLRDAIPTAVVHAGLWFAERTGLRRYDLCAGNSPAELLLGEWTFAAAAFPDAHDRALDDAYLDQLRASAGLLRAAGADPAALVEDVTALRAAATEFVDEAARRVLATGARIVGCTSTFEQHVASLALLRRIRELAPDVVTMMGGANCEADMGQATHACFPWVDYVVSGEADGLISDLCRAVLDRGRDLAADELPRGVLGPCHRGHTDGPATPPALPRALFRDLDTLPTPVFADYFRDLAASGLHTRIRPGLPLETSRGCWWGARHQCTFCGLNGSSMAYRSKAPENVLREIRELEDTYGTSSFEVVDNILDMRYFHTVLPALAKDAPHRRRDLFYEVKANLTRAQIELLVAAGVTWVQPGIESLHTDVLRLMDKGVSGWQNIQLLKWARELGMRMSWSVLWGFPGEDDTAYELQAAWMPLLEHLQAPGGLTRLRYDRFSVYHQRAQETGLLLMPVPAMAYVYPVPPDRHAALTYFFTDRPGTGRLDLGLRERADLSARPGVAAVREAIRHWQAAFADPLRPVLSLADSGERVTILDTRGCAVRRRTVLTGLDRAVLLACDNAPRPAGLPGILARDHGIEATEEAVTAATDRLVADRLVLPIDGRLLGLPVRGAIPPLPPTARFPGGHVLTGSAA